MFSFLRRLTLVHWILISMVAGILFGWVFPDRHWSGKVQSVSAEASELRVVAPDEKEVTLHREGKPGMTWMGRDTARDQAVTVTIERGGARTEPKEGDTVKVEYQTFAAAHLKPFSTLFLRMIQSLIAPLLFATLVLGIAGHGDDMKRVGRLALRSIIYFEIVTTLALFIGLAAVNLVQPGVGVKLPPPTADEQKIAELKANDPSKDGGILSHILDHLVPRSVVQAAASNEVLQIVFWSILFAVALTHVKGRPKEVVLSFMEGLAEVMFKFTGIVMLYAPIGIGVAMAVTVGHSGLGVLYNLGLLILTLYGALFVFLLVVLLPAALWARIPFRKFGRAIKEPALLAFATTSSEAALPKAMLAMEAIGVPRRIVAFVMPTGYSFNLDGTTLYLAIATIFAFQAGGIQLPLGEQLLIMLTLMLTSKGVAAVPRASLVILTGTLSSFQPELLPAVALILGVDEIMDMARTTVNLIGNCLAACVMARWEGEFDDNATGIEPGAETTPETAPVTTPEPEPAAE
jgi:proton glutamate symport protein